jgi:hypothetical protein
MNLRPAVFLTLLTIAPVLAIADATPLFTDTWPLEMELLIKPADLCRLEDKTMCEELDTTLSWELDGQTSHSVPVQVRTRGNWRLKNRICTLPPLFLEFSSDQTQGTLFAGQEMLPLTTHCSNKQKLPNDNVLKEYMAYRIYQLLSPVSVRVRLVHIRYSEAKRSSFYRARYGFLNEHFNSVAARNDAELWGQDELDLSQADPMEMAIMELFQYMIGNTDFSAIADHNVVLLKSSEARIIPLPFDFDFSGLVDAAYAGPPPELPLRNNRQRLYRGFCHKNLDWNELFRHFLEKETQVFELLESIPGLSSVARRSSIRYLGSFFSILNSEKKRRKYIIEACRHYPAT